MKTLYLIRHAKSSWDNPLLSDFDRPLNERGEDDAPFMGNVLRQLDVKPDIIISSPAKRAITTAFYIAAAVNYPNDEIIQNNKLYLADADDILEVIQEIPNNNNIAFIFGHNPGFTDMANTLSNISVENIPTCGIFCIDFYVNNWADIKKGIGEFKLFDYPKKHN